MTRAPAADPDAWPHGARVVRADCVATVRSARTRGHLSVGRADLTACSSRRRRGTRVWRALSTSCAWRGMCVRWAALSRPGERRTARGVAHAHHRHRWRRLCGRGSLAAAGLVSVHEEWLDHDYKELSVPPATAGMRSSPTRCTSGRGAAHADRAAQHGRQLHRHAVPGAHWRGQLPPLATDEAVAGFFQHQFPTRCRSCRICSASSRATRRASLAPCTPLPGRWRGACCCWHAAHAIFPFTPGHERRIRRLRGTRCARGARRDWPAVVAQFEQGAPPNAAAIAHMALENYTEMRDAVLDARFVRRQGARHGTGAALSRSPSFRAIQCDVSPRDQHTEALRRGRCRRSCSMSWTRDRAATGSDRANSWSGNACRR